MSLNVAGRNSVKLICEMQCRCRSSDYNDISEKMVLDRFDLDHTKGKWVALIDDVFRKGTSIETMERLLKQTGGIVVA